MFTVERASLSDLPRIADLGRRTYVQHFATIWSPAGLERFLDTHFGVASLRRQFADPRVQYFLAWSDSTPVGFAKIILESPLPVAADKGVDVELQKIYCLAEAVGQGHGGRLIAAAVDAAREHGAQSLWLHTLKTNVSARRIYERAGFAIVGERPFATDIAEFGFWVMRRAIA
jgi:ribosomal protein S18 acetylase RimI-like enzyme